MFPCWFYILFINVGDLVNVHSHETTDKSHDVTKKHVSGVAPCNKGKMNLNDKMEDVDSDEGGDQVLYGDITVYRHSDFEGENDSNERDEEASDDKNDDSSEGDDDFKKKALQTGDTFTPFEMLPVATKLFKKVHEEEIIEGRGIVSSSKSPEELADKLFGAYFITTRRIVHLTENDLSGLDALQALALDGEVVRTRTSGDSFTEKPEQIFELNGQLVGLDQQYQRCHYKLLFKKVSPSDSVIRQGKTGLFPQFNKTLKLEKKMSPNRHLIINHRGRKSNKVNNNSKMGVRAENNSANEEEVMVKKDGEPTKHKVSQEGKKKGKKLKLEQKLKHRQNKTDLARNKKLKKQRKLRKNNNKPKFTEKLKHLRNKNIDSNLPITTTQRPVCKWRYICKIRGDLDTCRLHTSCVDGKNNKLMLDKKYVDTEGRRKNKEKEELVMHFRKMLGLTALDEEVEKIIEQHVLLVKPENMRPDSKIESLDEYFNNIIMAQHTSTTPGYSLSGEREMETPRNLAGMVSEATAQYSTSSREDLRQINGGKVKTKSTPLSNVRDPNNFHISESTMITTPKYNKRYVY